MQVLICALLSLITPASGVELDKNKLHVGCCFWTLDMCLISLYKQLFQLIPGQ